MPIPTPLQPGRDTLQPAPLDLLRTTVKPEWTDYNGHFNVAYYVVAFDQATDALFDMLDIGRAYVERTNRSAFVLETHVCYLAELLEGAPLRVTGQLLDADEKRLHVFFWMHHATEGFLSATSELLGLHVDLDSRRSAPFPPEVQARIELVRAAHAGLARPEAAGRTIAIRRHG